MAASMRAKMMIESVLQYKGQKSETLKLRAVAKKGSYPSDGSDEDNTYATFSPSATMDISITNPALVGKFNPGEFYYVDFTPVSVE